MYSFSTFCAAVPVLKCFIVPLFSGRQAPPPWKEEKLFPVQKFRFQISALLDVCNNGSPAPEQCRFKVSIKILYLLLSVDILKRSPCTVPKRRAHRREKFCTKVSHDYGFAQRVKRRPERLYTELFRHLNETMGCSMQFCREERRRVGTE